MQPFVVSHKNLCCSIAAKLLAAMVGKAVSTGDLAAYRPGNSVYDAKIMRMEKSVSVIIAGLGEDVSREGLIDTPKVNRALYYVPASTLLLATTC